MKNYQNLTITNQEVYRVLKIVNNKVSVPFTIFKLMNNIYLSDTPMNDYWCINISKVDAKDLEKWDKYKYTDGHNNGKIMLIKAYND